MPKNVILEIVRRAMIPRFESVAPALHDPVDHNAGRRRVSGTPGDIGLLPERGQNLISRHLPLGADRMVVIVRFNLRQRRQAIHAGRADGHQK